MKTDSNTTIEEYKEYFNQFCAERRWDRQTPRELILSMMIELGELAEHYQWEDQYAEENHHNFEKISEELVDIFNYLVLFAKRTGIDIAKAGFKKLDKLDKKYPVVDVKDGLGRQNYYKRKKEYRTKGVN